LWWNNLLYTSSLIVIVFHWIHSCTMQWVLSVRNDPLGRPCLDNVFTNTGTPRDDETSDALSAQYSMHPVGRLDYDTTGLLLFSSSGPLTQALLHPKHAIEKEYVATVTGVVQEEALRTTLRDGVATGEGVHTANLLSVAHMPPGHVANYLQRIQAEFPTSYNLTDLKQRGYLDVLEATDLSIVTLTVSEGKHRMVRRMLANTGHPVVSLHRTRIGAIRLVEEAMSEGGNRDRGTELDTPTVLQPGQSRSLTRSELLWAQQQLKQGRQNSLPNTISDDVDDERGEAHVG
jgi:pseudouridine synthase